MDHSHQTLYKLFSSSKQTAIKKGVILVQGYQEPPGVIYIHSGYIKAYDIDAEGIRQLVAMSGPGEVLPLYWALDDQNLGLFQETMSTAVIGVIPKDQFQALVYDDPVMLRELMQGLLYSYRFSQQRIRNLQFRTARERLAYQLSLLCEYYSHVENNLIIIDVPIVYQDIADMTNLSRETVNTIMNEFITENLITRAKRHFTITDLSALRNIFGN